MIEENGTVTFTCRDCGASGKIYSNRAPFEEYQCPACAGYGKQTPCPTCNGRGSFPYPPRT